MLLEDGTTMRVPQPENAVSHPYSDFLLHDMGPALADDAGTTVGRLQGRARGNQWRTAPLWGIGLKATYLHDGRASDIGSAILAHDGEARIVRDRYAALSSAESDALIEFLLTL